MSGGGIPARTPIAYWSPKAELMSRDELTQLQLGRPKSIVARAYHNGPFYQETLLETGVERDDLQTLDDIIRPPWTTKRELLASQQAYPASASGYEQIPHSLAKAKGRLTPAYGYAAHIAEVEVDTLTGEVKVVTLTCFHDSGFPLNRLIVEGQIDGNVSMGLGQALKEEVVLR